MNINHGLLALLGIIAIIIVIILGNIIYLKQCKMADTCPHCEGEGIRKGTLTQPCKRCFGSGRYRG